MYWSIVRSACALSVLLVPVLPHAIKAQTVPPEQLAALTYRHIGPVGNRIASVSGVAGDPLTYYVGAASGGLWKTEDAGLNWRPALLYALGLLALCRL